MSEINDTYRKVFQSAEGEIVLRDLSRRFGIIDTAFSNNHADMAFSAGQKMVVREIFDRIHMASGAERTPDTAHDTYDSVLEVLKQ